MSKNIYLLLALCCFVGMQAAAGRDNAAKQDNVLIQNDGPNAVLVSYTLKGETPVEEVVSLGSKGFLVPGNIDQIAELSFESEKGVFTKKRGIDLVDVYNKTMAEYTEDQAVEDPKRRSYRFDPNDFGIVIRLFKGKSEAWKPEVWRFEAWPYSAKKIAKTKDDLIALTGFNWGSL